MLIDRPNTDWCMQFHFFVVSGFKSLRRQEPGQLWRCHILPGILTRAVNWPAHPSLAGTNSCKSKGWIYVTVCIICYPNRRKPLWESIENPQITEQSPESYLLLAGSRSNYQKHKTIHLAYQRNRKRASAKTKNFANNYQNICNWLLRVTGPGKSFINPG